MERETAGVSAQTGKIITTGYAIRQAQRASLSGNLTGILSGRRERVNRHLVSLFPEIENFILKFYDREKQIWHNEAEGGLDP